MGNRYDDRDSELNEMLRVAQHKQSIGELAAAAEILKLILSLRPTHPETLLARARLQMARKAGDNALTTLDVFDAAHGANAEALYLRAEVLLRKGRKKLALQCARKAQALRPDFYECHQIIGRLEMSGPSYYEVLGHIHRFLKPRIYCEIGVETCASLALAGTSERAIGIDPDPQPADTLPDNATIYAMESDRFFAEEADTVFADAPIALGFIDGLHEAQQALRDFLHMERHATADATLMLHDVVPLDGVSAAPIRETLFWSGDVWRTLMALRTCLPGLDILTMNVPPSGIALVRGLNPNRNLSGSALAKIYDYIAALDYDDIADRRWPALDIQAFDADRIVEFLS